mmetsp:Transcript_43204/g.72014  ORF Transcript_43204/g.72014 Transcript_43204/m.72014 type:complete len:760 (-) Transcript_43204:174-2453(-)|eukprot:CAMPEP_0198205580 /NCGR_PEP_ID=MMETSP1445-20131203/9118_1 /TAXON_ID=36898 /ORGANISM="Pyramimonas sp., Strain CCMP2087" /LENGTH=759 /DNA_ID=CAMNT_0043877937 /DNA_START=100 /DNA_END=2379 /DNA_ORIENTATION=-
MASEIKAVDMSRDRKCTDLLFLIMFAAFWVGMIITAGIAWAEGDPRTLVYGLDYRGNVCGKDNDAPGNMDLDGFRFQYWPNTNQLFDAADPLNVLQFDNALSICLSECPTPLGTNGTNGTTVNGTANGTAASEAKVHWVCKYPEDAGMEFGGDYNLKEWKADTFDYYDKLNSTLQETSLNLRGPCYPITLKSRSQYWSCQYYGDYEQSVVEAWEKLGGKELDSKDGGLAGVENLIQGYLKDPTRIFQRYISDIQQASTVEVVCGFVVPVVACFIFLILMRYFVTPLSYLILVLVNVTSVLFTIFAFIKAGWIGNNALNAFTGQSGNSTSISFVGSDGLDLDASEDNKTVMKVLAGIMVAVSIIIFLFTIAMLSKMKVGIAVLKVGLRATTKNPTTVLLPLLTISLIILLALYSAVTALYLFSAGDIEKNTCDEGEGDDCGWDVDLNQSVKRMLAYHFFGFLWTLYFIIGVSYVTLAGVFGEYYFKKGEMNSLTASPVVSSLQRTGRYHLGSVALGAFIIALIEFVRAIISYMKAKAEQTAKSVGGGTASSIVTKLFCYVECCLCCLSMIIKYISRQAYIVIALTGCGYCSASRKVVDILTSNIIQVAAVNVIGDSILFLGKLTIAFGSSVLAYLWLDTENYETGDDAISSPVVPVLLVFLLAYGIATGIFGVTEMGVDTILMAYLMDAAENDGVAVNAPPELNSSFDNLKEECEKAARAMDKNSDPPTNQRASTTSARGSVFSQHRQSGASQAPGATSL